MRLWSTVVSQDQTTPSAVGAAIVPATVAIVVLLPRLPAPARYLL